MFNSQLYVFIKKIFSFFQLYVRKTDWRKAKKREVQKSTKWGQDRVVTARKKKKGKGKLTLSSQSLLSGI